MAERVRVVVADDHPIFRSGLREVLAAEPSIIIAEEAADGESALRAVLSQKPDVAILDIDMPKKNGLDVMNALRAARCESAVIFLTMYNDREMFNRAIDIGARGYVLKESAAREIVEAVRLVADGKYYVSPGLSAHLIERNARAEEFRTSVPGLALLTPSERRILSLIADGKTSKEIAVSLNVSVRTVDNHRLNISGKLNLRG